MYILPSGSNELDSTISSSEEESYTESSTTDSSPTKNWDLHTIDMDSSHFKSLPIDVRHEILTDLKETRKQSSWGRIHELPKVSDDFSDYQMRRLLKRQAVQTALEEAEKEMGGKALSLAELESILKDQGVITNQNIGNRIVSDETTKYLLVKDVKKAMEEARKRELVIMEEDENVKEDNKEEENKSMDEHKEKTKADLEYEEDLQKAIALSLENEPTSSEETVQESKSSSSKKLNPAEFSFLENFTDADFASSSSEEEEREMLQQQSKLKLSSAQSYMMEYSGLTPSEINKIINTKNTTDGSTKRVRFKKPILSGIPEGLLGDDSKSADCKNGKVVEIMSSSDSEVDVSSKGETKSNECSEMEIPKDKLVEIQNDKLPEEDISVKCQPKNNEDLQTGVDDSVEIMSSTDSSDSEIDEKNTKTELSIVIDPNSKPSEEDDLFADIFESPVSNLDDLASKEAKKNDEIDLKINSAVNVELSVEENVAKLEKEIDEVKEDSKKYEVVHKDLKESEGDKKEESVVVELKDSVVTEVKEKHSSLNKAVEDSVKEACVEVKKPAVTEEELRKLKDQLQRDKVELLTEKSTKERMAGNITDQMYQEAQELLELFGVPYLIAPMEAEAQCAFLDAIDLTDGTITDDSDIWLFGGKTVYKNFFNQTKYVMEFRSENIQHHFKLTREQMILLALLVGSDYTVGLQGVGPVTAMEILAAFPPSKGRAQEFSLSQSELLSGLKEFRSWFLKGKSPGPGRLSLKNKLKNISFHDNFPSAQVVEAYLDPKVETSRESFSWGRPNKLALLEFAREKFGWTKMKTEEILNPVLQKIEESKHQKSIRDYFKTRYKIHSDNAEKKMSKRIKSAITNMGKDPAEILAEELQEELKKQPRKQSTRKKKTVTEAPEFANSKSKIKEKPNQEDFEQPQKAKRNTRKKVNLEKLKSPTGKEASQIDPTREQEVNECNQDEDIADKINTIRRRRKIKEAKDAVEVKKPKIVKEKVPPTGQLLEEISQDLKVDEEVLLLSKLVTDSSQKIDEINQSMRQKLEEIEAKACEVPKIVASSSGLQHVSNATANVKRPVPRVTRIPHKETIPQKEREKTTVLRNKLKAIEVFRKGKHGPGYVKKKDRKKRLPKNEAALSESSDE